MIILTINRGNEISKIQKIKNYQWIANRGNSNARQKVLQLMDAVLQDVDAGQRIREIMTLEGNILRVGVCEWDLSKKSIFICLEQVRLVTPWLKLSAIFWETGLQKELSR